MASNLYQKAIYRAPVDYLINTFIREYDMRKANINILLWRGAITQKQYDDLYNSPKMRREIAIGLFLRNNPAMSKVLKDGITEARRLFFEANGIEDYEVLSIKNDAIYVINKIPPVRVFNDLLEFVEKNVYTSFYRFGNKELYYYSSLTDTAEKLDVKGIKDSELELHQGYFLDFLLDIFYTAQTDSVERVLRKIQSFYNDYTNLRLPLEYYRRFDSTGFFDMKAFSHYRSYSVVNGLGESDKDFIDISYNASIINTLYKIFSSLYFQQNKP